MYQKVIIAGRLGKDPELRYTQGGDAVCNFSVATAHGFGENEKTEWFDVVTWRKTAEACANHLSKGRAVLVEGHMQTRSWQSGNETKYKTELHASKVQFLGVKSESQESQGGGYSAPPPEVTDIEPF